MNTLLQDPTDPTIWIIGSAAEPTIGAQCGPTALRNVHPERACSGWACVIHNPSRHHMASWPLNWRDARGIMERICPHGVGHPDPDDAAFHVRSGRDSAEVHSCDGCCQTPGG
jgi:hypothetical protein